MAREFYGIEPLTDAEREELRDVIRKTKDERRAFGPVGKLVDDTAPMLVPIPMGHTGFSEVLLTCDERHRRRGRAIIADLLERLPTIGLSRGDLQVVGFMTETREYHGTRNDYVRHFHRGLTCLFSDHVRLRDEIKDLMYRVARRHLKSGRLMKIGYVRTDIQYRGIRIKRT